MPARIGDTRTSHQKVEDAKKAIYSLLSVDQQSWGTLRKTAKLKGISSSTLAKYLKQFTEEGIVVKREESESNSKLPRTYYRLTSQKPFFGNLTERDIQVFLKTTPGIQFTEEEDQAWTYMDTALKIFTYFLAEVLASSSKMDKEKASRYIDTMLQVRLKEELMEVMKVYQKYKHIKNGTIPMSSFAAESFMIQAEESAETWVSKKLLKKYGGGLPNAEISIAWSLLTSSSEKEAVKKIEKEIDEIQQALADSYKK
jgi:DNA-binding HxlR family transcriptional regulator